jgi:hypothetical protein
MSGRPVAIDDRALLKLLETGLGESVAAKYLDIPTDAITDRVKEYLACGILRCNGESEVIDWRAYGRWAKRQKPDQGL